MNARTTEEITSVIRTAVQAATWAPSVHNTQPWSFVADGMRSRCVPTATESCGSATPPAESC